jgi:hypothetical protein
MPGFTGYRAMAYASAPRDIGPNPSAARPLPVRFLPQDPAAAAFAGSVRGWRYEPWPPELAGRLVIDNTGEPARHITRIVTALRPAGR